MDEFVSPERVAQLWDRYVEVLRQYQVVKDATDAAEAACEETRRACHAAYDACESAYALELQCSRAVQVAGEEFEAASDAVFLSRHGIQAS